MFDANRYFDSENDSLIAWVGSLTSQELNDYLHEPGGMADDEPKSKFARDLGRAYDHDLICAQGADEPTSLKDLARLNYLTDRELISELEERAQVTASISCFLILWNARRIDETDRNFADGRLQCIGSWKHKSPFQGF